jgi:phosphoglycolate phosphatase
VSVPIKDLTGLTVVFDLDGTLVDTAPDLMGNIDRLLVSKGLEPAPHDLMRPLISYGSKAMLTAALDRIGHRIDAATYDAWWQEYLGLYLAHIADRSRPFPGVEVVLERLAARGARLAVCTNKGEMPARKLLDILGLTSRFAGIAGRDTFPRCTKPNPEHLRGAVRLAGGDPARAIMVGDSDVDIEAAKNAGVPVIAVTFGYTPAHVSTFGPDAVIDHFDAFDGAFTPLAARLARA